MEKINKIIEYVKKNYIVFTVVFALILVIVGVIIIVNIINGKKEKIVYSSDNYSLYYYFGDTKKEINTKVNFENDKIVSLSDKNIYGDSFLYIENEDKMIIPKNMAVVFYNQNNLTYHLPVYSYLEYDTGNLFLTVNGKKEVQTSFFIFDGSSMYFIPNDFVLKVNGNLMSLSAFSYIIANNGTVTVYNYKDDEIITYEDVKAASIKLNNIQVDLLKDAIVDSNDNVLKLTNYISDLPDL